MVISDEHSPRAEQELLASACSGDAQAFCRLVEPLQPRLLRQAAALSNDLPAAEDLVAETLVEAWRSLLRYNHTCRFSTWLYAILVRRYQKSIRRASLRPIAMAWLPFARAEQLREQQKRLRSPEASPADALLQTEATRHLRRCVEALPARQREIILLRFFQDASLPEMAAIIGCSIGTVKSRLHHALLNLRKMKLNLPHQKGD